MKTVLTFAVLLSMLLLVGGCAASKSVETDWDSIVASYEATYPDSAYWKAVGEGQAGDVQMATNVAALKARAAIARELGKTKVEGEYRSTEATLYDSPWVRRQVVKLDGSFSVKVLVVAPKRANPPER